MPDSQSAFEGPLKEYVLPFSSTDGGRWVLNRTYEIEIFHHSSSTLFIV